MFTAWNSVRPEPVEGQPARMHRSYFDKLSTNGAWEAAE